MNAGRRMNAGRYGMERNLNTEKERRDERSQGHGHGNGIRGLRARTRPLQSGAALIRRGRRRLGCVTQPYPLGLPAGRPVNDARGTRLERAAAHPDLLTDAPQLNITNVIAPNGGRIYVDHAHPEYSAPETTDPFEAVRYDRAGDLIMRAAAAKASETTGRKIVLHRNNVDGKGASWGTHENYMMLRSVPFDLVTRLMTTHFVSRQIFIGSGRVGIGEHSENAGYQLSQRATTSI